MGSSLEIEGFGLRSKHKCCILFEIWAQYCDISSLERHSRDSSGQKNLNWFFPGGWHRVSDSFHVIISFQSDCCNLIILICRMLLAVWKGFNKEKHVHRVQLRHLLLQRKSCPLTLTVLSPNLEQNATFVLRSEPKAFYF